MPFFVFSTFFFCLGAKRRRRLKYALGKHVVAIHGVLLLHSCLHHEALLTVLFKLLAGTVFAAIAEREFVSARAEHVEAIEWGANIMKGFFCIESQPAPGSAFVSCVLLRSGRRRLRCHGLRFESIGEGLHSVGR